MNADKNAVRKTEMRNKFLTRLKMIDPKINSALMTRKRYLDLVSEVKRVKRDGKKTPTDFWLMRRYDVLELMGTEKLIYPGTSNDQMRYYIAEDDLFNILHKSHICLGHAGRDRMLRDLKSFYKNITQKQVSTYLQCCEVCQQKKSGSKKEVSAKPMSSIFNSRCQVDLIDMQSQADGEYKFIFVYQDCLTRFIVLRPLKSKQASEIATNLFDVFTTFGAPIILQSSNGREFVASVINSLEEMWPDLRIVNGKVNSNQNQGILKKENQIIENMILSWMKDNSSTKWSEGLRLVQFMKNRSQDAGIKRSPYESMFGCAPKIGLNNLSLPLTLLAALETEEDLERLQLEGALNCGEDHNSPESDSESASCTGQRVTGESNQNDDESIDLEPEDIKPVICVSCGVLCDYDRTLVAPDNSHLCEMCQGAGPSKRKDYVW